jgi:hypothetical protein
MRASYGLYKLISTNKKPNNKDSNRCASLFFFHLKYEFFGINEGNSNKYRKKRPDLQRKTKPIRVN